MEPFTIFINVIAVVIGYLIGSINPAYFFGRLKKFDIREKGDGIVLFLQAFFHMEGLPWTVLLIFGKHHGIFPGRLPFYRFYADWNTLEHNILGPDDVTDTADMAFLADSG